MAMRAKTIASVFLAAGVFTTLLPTAGHATFACTVVAVEGETGPVWLYSEPDKSSEQIRELPVGDLVNYPNTDFEQKEGWVFVRHDPSQEDIWQGGDPGWVPRANVTTCG